MNRRAALRSLAATASLAPLGLLGAGRAPEPDAGPSRAPRGLARLRVHAGGHYLQSEDGRPFFWLGDTAWFTMHRGLPDEVSYYLHTRARQGFTVIQTMLLPECDALRTPSDWGELPFDHLDPLQPREAYFRRIDDFFREAAAHGLYVAVVAAWGDKVTAPWGEGPRLFTLANLPVARAYGRWLGRRFAAHPNLIWILGGDRPPRLSGDPAGWAEKDAALAGFPADTDWTPVWREMAGGLREGSGPSPLLTYHPQGGASTSAYFPPTDGLLDFNSMQSGHGSGHDVPVWDWVTRDFNLAPAKPTFDSEPNYEDHPFNPWPRWDPATGWFRDHDVRKQCWRSVLAGACGVTYGHHAVWQWAGKRHEVINHADRDWRAALDRPAANQVRFLRDLLEGRPFFDRIPDQQLIAGDAGAGAEHIGATRDAAGTWAALYLPRNDQRVRVDLTRLAARSVRAWWYDPRNGLGESLGEMRAAPTDFVTPSYGPDWVLVLDDVAAGYPPPGLPKPTDPA